MLSTRLEAELRQAHLNVLFLQSNIKKKIFHTLLN